MSGLGTLVGFIACSDGVQAREFYVGLLGLDLVSDDPFALVLRAGATTLRIQKLAQVTAQPYTVLGWQVDDLSAQIARLRDAGVVFEKFQGLEQDADAVWRAPSGGRIVWFKDSDHNILSLTELPI